MTRKKIPDNQIIIYQTQDGQAKLNVYFEGDTVWLTQKLIAQLFECSVDNVSLHLSNIFKEEELSPHSVIEEYSITAKDGKKYKTKHYNLDAIISVGYRVNSNRATQFRIWATQTLREYIIKGFALDDDRMKQGGKRARYFEELLQRIRDIRSSERNFYQKVTDIYATSIDYRKNDVLTKKFFATVQNKIHYAVHEHTASELISLRVNAKKPLMGLTGFKGEYITPADTHIAKNYLTEPEIKQLNLIVSFYLDFAELQASNKRPMKMADWTNKLDEFLNLSEKKILHNAGVVSAKVAVLKANLEYKKYRQKQDKKYISDFDREVKKYLTQKKKAKNEISAT